MKIKIGFLKTHEDARLPERNNKDLYIGDSGYDVYSVENVIVPAKSTVTVPIGLDVGYIEPGFWVRVESRSGLFFKHCISVFNGIIDNSFRGSIKIGLTNNSNTYYEILKGDRVAQLVIYKLIEPEIVWLTSKVETNRGDRGFGSSGR